MKIERVTRFIKASCGYASNPGSSGPRIVMVSLPRVRFLEGAPTSSKYYHDSEITEARIAHELDISEEKVHNFFYRRR